jgi:hypothetical protein
VLSSILASGKRQGKNPLDVLIELLVSQDQSKILALVPPTCHSRELLRCLAGDGVARSVPLAIPGWGKRTSGGLKEQECRRLLEHLQAQRWLKLPSVRNSGPRGPRHIEVCPVHRKPEWKEAQKSSDRSSSKSWRTANKASCGRN